MSGDFLANPAAWSYGLAALAFAAFSLQLSLGWKGGIRAAVLVTTLVASTLWAGTTLLFALDAGEWSWRFARVFDVARIGGWLAFVLLLGTPVDASHATRVVRRAASPWLLALAGLLLIANLALPVPGEVPLATTAGRDSLLFAAGLGLAILGLVLVEQLYRRTPEHARWGIKPLALGLAGMFAFDLFLFSDAMLFRRIDPDIWAARGFAHALVIPFAAVATARNTAWTIDLHVSRGVVLHSTALLVSGAYLLAMAAAGYYVRFFGGSWGKMLQVALGFAAILFLAFVVVSGRFRSRLRVFVSKNFFSYRFDYREEWLRFTHTLSTRTPHLGVQELCIKALADLVESSAGVLWLRGEDGFRQVSRWNLPEVRDVEPRNSPLAGFLERTGWVVDLQECAAVPERYEGIGLPAWLGFLRDAWLVVPLVNGTELVGFVVLAQPRAAMQLDWEVRDLLKTAGQQAATYLAQMQATEQLLEARKFDAFNRMSAFVVHDLKNLVAQLSLLLRNSERHRNNPDFQRDVLETVEHVTQRMNAIMLQLRSGTTPVEGPKPVEVGVLARKIQRAKANQRPAIAVEAAEVYALGHEDRLERVIGHLIQNAVDAAGEKGHVAVRVFREGTNAVVEVADDGAGMTPEFVRDRLFKPFQTTKPHGMGIGVYESFQYVTGLGGRIVVDSAPNAGTKVRVFLPRSDLSAAGEESLKEVA
ncbi:MAG TPA: XrtA/PEP-CTERM system histidine kinase PrsK [Burkholderiales bacterium]|nr:XrtA/PEP-CTERM system histidine kinase PrsK [Burkholderiales bacterium]